MNKLREKIERGERVIGTHVSLSDPCICEIFSYLGFDYIWVDMEHTYIDCKTLYSHVLAGKAEGVSVIVRVPQHDLTTLKRVLEMGVDGIVFPMICSVEEAREDISKSLYPPEGARGFGPRRAIRYGLDDVQKYIHESSLEVCRFIQLEHRSAIECLADIMEIPRIDGFVFGPCDLAGSYGKPGDYLDGQITDIIRDTVRKLKEGGKYCGVSIGDYSADSVRHWNELGMDMVSTGSDTDYLLAGAQAAFRNLAAFHRTRGRAQ